MGRPWPIFSFSSKTQEPLSENHTGPMVCDPLLWHNPFQIFRSASMWLGVFIELVLDELEYFFRLSPSTVLTIVG